MTQKLRRNEYPVISHRQRPETLPQIMHRLEIPNPVRPQPSAKFLERIPNPNQSHRLQRPPTENHSSEAIIGGVETAAGAFALVLESDAPIWALDASAIGFDTDWAEQIEPAFS